MRTFPTTILAAALFAAFAPMSPVWAAPIRGDINFDGSNTYSTASHTVDFIGGQNAQSDTGDLALFGVCTGCVTFKDLTYSPFTPVTNEITGTQNGRSLAVDLQSIDTVNSSPTFLDLAGTAILHLSGFDATPGSFFFSTQGPQGPEVSFSATTLAVAEPASLTVLGFGVLGLALARRAERSQRG